MNKNKKSMIIFHNLKTQKKKKNSFEKYKQLNEINKDIVLQVAQFIPNSKSLQVLVSHKSRFPYVEGDEMVDDSYSRKLLLLTILNKSMVL